MGQSTTFARISQNYFKNFDSFVQIFEHRQKTQSFTHFGKFIKTKNEKSSSNLIDVSHWRFYIYIAQNQYFQPFNGQKQPPEVFCKKRYFRNFAKFTGKHLCHCLFFNKVAGKKKTLAQVFSCEFCEISKNTLFTEHFRTTASGWIFSLRSFHVQVKQLNKGLNKVHNFFSNSSFFVF